MRGEDVQERVEVEGDVQGVGVRRDKHMVMEMNMTFKKTRIDVASYVLSLDGLSRTRVQKDHVCVLLQCGEVRTLCICAYTNYTPKTTH